MSSAIGAVAMTLALTAVPAGAVHALPTAPAVPPGAAIALPSESIYHIDARLQEADGEWRTVRSLAGRPAVLAMFYSACSSVCPILVPQMQKIEAALAATDRDRIRFVLVSLDSSGDTPATLTAFATAHHLDSARWIVARASATDVRTIAAALGVKYRRLPDGSFNHSTVVTLLDAQGVARGRMQVPSADERELVSTLHTLLQ